MANPDASVSRTPADIVFDAFFLAGFGGSMVGLFFLVIDVSNGQPFFTPSLLGSVLFGGAAAETGVEVSMEMAAYYTIVHFATFGALGLGVAFLVYEVELHARHTALVLLLLFLGFELAFVFGASILMPGVIETLGPLRVGVANLLAAASMALFLLASHRPDLWQRLRPAAHLG